ncbi:MAG: ABC transporter ATP-binding protein, partial [Spirochaetales bacterium]|nr:ABC transporter ATP-binding protein [Spirochaetales bacterium]
MKNAIEIRKLTKDYKDIRAVDNLDLEIHEGELFALLGVNGAGKTTTIKMLCCITQPTSGDALLNGKSIASEADAVKKIIAVSPQETAVAPNLSVEENLKLMCGVHGFDMQRAEKRTNEMIEEFKLDRIRKKKASKLSGGWQRRLSIAMALISEPQI